MPVKDNWANGQTVNASDLNELGVAINTLEESGGGGGSFDLPAAVHAATGKTTPVDADELALVDSAASNGLKKLTFANLKAWVKAWIAKGDVGLGNVDNTADTAKPVSTAQQAALDLKAPIASPTFTGTVSGVTKAMVGLGSVDNTSDASKPVSASQQAALDGKQNLDATLTALAGLSTAANKLLYATGSDTFATTDLTGFARTLIDDADAATARATLGAAAAPTPQSAIWAITSDLQAQPVHPAVVAIGDSFTSNGYVVNAWNGSSFSRNSAYSAMGYLTCAMVWNRQPATWVPKGVSGQTAAQGLARFDTDVTPLLPQVVVIEFGSNDMLASRTAAATFADLQAMWTKAWAWGAKVIATTCPPRNGFSTGQKQEANKLNTMLRNYAATNPQNFALVDMYAALTDPLTGNFLTGLVNADGIHPNTAGAWAIGKAFESALDRFLPTPTPTLATGANDDNLLATPLMSATGGSIAGSNGITGDCAADWGAFSTGNDANTTCVLSRVARSDGYGSWQQITNTATPTVNDYVTFYQNVTTGWSVGDLVQASIEFETDSAGWTNGILQFRLNCIDNSFTYYSVAGGFSTGSDSVILTRPESGVMVTPPVAIPTGTTKLFLTFDKGALGTVRVGRAAIRKLPTS